MTRRPDMPGPGRALAELRTHVALLERQVREGVSLADDELALLDALARESAPLSARLRGRIATLNRQAALQDRAVPAGVLDDLVQAVRTQVAEESEDPARYWRRAGLSHSFLDAPRQLALWRRMAVAAVLLLGVGAGAVFSGVLRWHSEDTASDRTANQDPRDELLPPDDRGSWPPTRAGLQSPLGTDPALGPRLVHVVRDGRARLPSKGVADTTVVFPMRDLSSPNVSDMLDGLAIPDIGSARLIEHN